MFGHVVKIVDVRYHLHTYNCTPVVDPSSARCWFRSHNVSWQFVRLFSLPFWMKEMMSLRIVKQHLWVFINFTGMSDPCYMRKLGSVSALLALLCLELLLSSYCLVRAAITGFSPFSGELSCSNMSKAPSNKASLSGCISCQWIRMWVRPVAAKFKVCSPSRQVEICQMAVNSFKSLSLLKW